jgi:hypothetical protein
MVQLHDIISGKHSKLNKQGFIIDKSLSSRNQQVFYNPKEKKLIYNVSGSHSLHDWLVTNPYLAVGKLKQTRRYQQAHQGLRQAKEKYKIPALVTGSSLGGAVASGIGQKEDRIVTYNKGATFGQKTRDIETSYRIRDDPVSVLSSFDKNTKTLSNNNVKTPFTLLNSYNSHMAHNLKGRNIIV